MSEPVLAVTHDRHRVIEVCLLVVALAMLALTGCGESDDGINTYTVAKSQGHFGSSLLTQPNTPPPSQQQTASPRELVSWTMPPSWHEEPSNRQMVLAVFHTDHSHNLEVQVSAFEGDVGGLLANVNRWRNQLSLPPVAEEALGDHLEEIPTQGSFGGLFDATNPQTDTRTVAVVIQGGAGMSWFIKATGQPQAVEAQKENIKAFAASFRFKENTSQPAPAAATSQLTDGAAPGSTMGALPASMLPPDAAEKLTLATPENWQPATPSSPVILQAFDVGQGEDRGQMTITQLRGDGGGLLPNINRWRGQIGLAPVASLDQQPLAMLQVAGSTAILVELTAPADSAQAGQGILMAVVARPRETWYFKMTGRAAALQSLRPQFVAVVQSARFTEVHP